MTRTETVYSLEVKEGARWKHLDTRMNLRYSKKMLALYKTSGLWHNEPLRIVKTVTQVTFKVTKTIL